MKKLIIIVFAFLLIPFSLFGKNSEDENKESKFVELKIATMVAATSTSQDKEKKEQSESEPAISKIDRPIILDIDSEFLSIPLPPTNPNRYKQWSKKAFIQVGQSHLLTIDLTGDEQYLLAMSEMEATVRIYLRKTRKLIGNFKVPGFEYESFNRGDVVLWPVINDEPMFLTGNKMGLNLFSALTGNLIAHLHDSPVWKMRWSPDGRILICVVSDIGTQTSRLTFFKRISPQSLEEIKTIQFINRVDSFVLTRDNRFLVVTLYPSDRVELIDLHTGEAVWSIPSPLYTTTLDMSPDGNTIAVGGESLLLIDVNNPSHRSTYSDFQNNIHKVRFSPSGDAVAVSSYDGHVRIISTEMTSSNATLIKDLRHAGTSNVYSLVFGRDGSFLISSSGDRTILFWGK